MRTGRPKAELVLSEDERLQLQSFARSRSLPAALCSRARLVSCPPFFADLAAHCRERFATEIQQGRLVAVEGAIVDTPVAAGGPRVRERLHNSPETCMT
jgi:hypothetical protein